MHRPGLFSFVFLAATFLTVSPRAQTVSVQDMRYEVLGADERRIVDRIAADFYEEDLSRTQSAVIEAATTATYLAGSEDERAEFREERRAAWRAMPASAQRSLRGAEHPRYDNLTEEQKAPFRRHALNRLSAAGALDEDVLDEALAADI